MDRAEQAGLGVAVVGHAAVLAALTLGISTWDPVPPSPPIEVSFVEDAALASAAPQVSTQAPARGAAPLAGTPEDAPALPRPAATAPQPSRPTPQPTPTPPRDLRQQPQPRNADAGRQPQRPTIGDEILKGIGRDPSPSRAERPPATMTGAQRASIRSLIARALVPCERQPFPAPQARAIKVDVRVTLTRSGGLASAEIIRVHNPDPALERYEQRMRELALAVVRECTPITSLPDEFYDVPGGWRQFPYRFPRD